MPSKPSSAVNRKTTKRVKKTDDIEVHVSRLSFMGREVVEIREFVLSTKTYGRGVTLPYEVAARVGEGVLAASLEPVQT